MFSKSFVRTLRIQLMSGAILFVAAANVRAGTTDSLCSLADDTMRASLQLAPIEPLSSVDAKEVPGAGTLDTLSCTWTSQTRDRALTLTLTSTSTSSSFPVDMPVSCSEQKDADKAMVMCMAGAGSPVGWAEFAKPNAWLFDR